MSNGDAKDQGEKRIVRQIDVREIAGCTGLRLRRTTRCATQIYDRFLEPAGLTVNQFGLLAYLYGVAAAGQSEGLSIGALAERVGMDATTLNRSLKRLEEQGFVESGAGAEDRRVRMVRITGTGAGRLEEAVPRWRKAQAKVEEVLGLQATAALNGLLDLFSAKLSG